MLRLTILQESALAPIRILTSRTALKAYLSTILFLLASTALLTISTTAYLFFYFNYIPPINLSRSLYLQYGLGACPYAIASLDHCPLISQQPYDVDIQLTMPRTPTNLAAGNFMVDLQLLGPYTANPLKTGDSLASLLRNVTAPKNSGLSVLHHSRRPAMLTYTSPIPFLAQTLLYLPFHIMNIRDLDSACLRIPMFERLSFPRGTANMPTHVRLEIQSDSSANTGSTMPTFNIPFLGSSGVTAGVSADVKPRALQVYGSKLTFAARFGGLRYVVYNYRVLSFVAFTAMFYFSAVASMAVAWAGISSFLGKEKSGKGNAVVKREESGAIGLGKGKRKADDELDDTQDQTQQRIKQEGDQDEDSTSGGLSTSNLSDTPDSFPTGSREPALQYQGRPQTSSTAAAQERLRRGEVADDEEAAEDRDGSQAMMEKAWERGAGPAGDSGIGTSMESEGPDGRGITRRRSGRGSSAGSGSRDRRA